MIFINKFSEIKGLTHSQFYKLTLELEKDDIGYGAKSNRKDPKKVDVLVRAEDLTHVLKLLSKVKTLESPI